MIFQLYIRRYRASWFNKYNFTLAAALDAGTQVAVFVMTFLVFGGVGPEINFPFWALNPDQESLHVFADYCYKDPDVVGGGDD